MKIRCIAVDDEPLALDLICSYISQTPFLELSARFDNSIDALKSIYDDQADVIFLDIQMKGMTGVELARVLSSGQHAIKIIFTTAYDQFAIEGYKVDAVDYLLKPFSYEEFLRASNKVKLLLEDRQSVQIQEPKEEYLFLKVEHSLVRVAYDEIKYIEGFKDYVKVHLENDKIILSLTSLKNLEEILPSHLFMRIHRSYIISLSKVDSLTKNSIQIGKMYISVTDNYREQFDQFVNKWRN